MVSSTDFQHRIQGSSFLEELTALTALSPFYRSVYKLIEALARMPTGDATCTWVQQLAAEGTPDGFPQALMTRAMILPLWMEAASLRG